MRMRRNALRDDEAAPQGDYTNEKKYIFIYIYIYISTDCGGRQLPRFTTTAMYAHVRGWVGDEEGERGVLLCALVTHE